MSSSPEATGPKSENPYCVRCGKHLGMAFHETNEHDEAASKTPAGGRVPSGTPVVAGSEREALTVPPAGSTELGDLS